MVFGFGVSGVGFRVERLGLGVSEFGISSRQATKLNSRGLSERQKKLRTIFRTHLADWVSAWREQIVLVRGAWTHGPMLTSCIGTLFLGLNSSRALIEISWSPY